MKDISNLNELIELCNNLSVLYVEDDSMLNQVNTSILESIFKRVDSCTNGKEALEKYIEKKADSNTYDLVITDINMPYMNGIELSKEVLKLDSSQQILIISAYNDSDKLELLIQLGIKYYVQKPVSTEKFFEVLEKIAKEIHEKNISKELTAELTSYDNITKLKNIHALYEDLKLNKFENIFIIELTNFENIQSFYGIEKSDAILNDLIVHLKEKISCKKCLYRKGTNKIAYMFNDKIQKTLNNFVEKLEESMFSYCIGISSQKENLVTTAKMALKYARNHKLRYKKYSKDIDTKDMDFNSLKMQEVISEAIKENSVFPVFQPIFNKNKELIKYEILMRIKSNKKNKVYFPNEFIDIALETNKFDELNILMLEKLFDTIRNSDKKFSFNISYQDIVHTKLCDYMEEKFKKEPTLAKKFIFELLETHEIEDYKILDDFIKRFKKHGVLIALDDFGTGYSNLSQIVNMDLDYVKIDGSLIKEINYNYKSLAIVKAMITFANETGIKTIAEFVSSESIFNKLQKIGIDEFQGFYLSKPLEKI